MTATNHIPAELPLEERKKYREYLVKLEHGDFTGLGYLIETLGRCRSSQLENYRQLGGILTTSAIGMQTELDALKRKCSVLEQELKKHTGIEW